jgi:hypothetical protein
MEAAVTPPPSGATAPWTFANYEITIPLVSGEFLGDLFCAGHVWLPNGKLFVAGGNRQYQVGGAGVYEGSKLAAIWDPAQVNVPPLHGWTFLPNMSTRRWYPTCTLLGNNTVVVSGGSEVSPHPYPYCTTLGSPTLLDKAFNTFEVWDIGAGAWEPDSFGNSRVYPGPYVPSPTSNCGTVLGEYPRMHLLSNNKVFLAGMFTGANRLWHDLSYVPPTACAQNAVANWETNPSVPAGCVPAASTPGWPKFSPQYRDYGSSVLLPNVGNVPGGRDRVMILGGAPGTPAGNTSSIIDGVGTAGWGSVQTMVHARQCANAVLLPNGEVFVCGGSSVNGFSGQAADAQLQSELYNEQMTPAWRGAASQYSPRMYHSTAVLLPSGQVLSGGGDVRAPLPNDPLQQHFADYEVFTPPYLTAGQARPQFAGSFGLPGSLTLNWDTEYAVGHAPLPPGVLVSRVVLMRPCSVTHHSDMDQRYVELVPNLTVETVDEIVVRTPKAPTAATTPGAVVMPRGWYMMFLITTQGTPSEAKWVRFP